MKRDFFFVRLFRQFFFASKKNNNSVNRTIIGIISNNDAGGAQYAMHNLCKIFMDKNINMRIYYLHSSYFGFSLNDDNVVLKLNSLENLNIFRVFFRTIYLFRKERPDAVIAYLPLATTVGLTAAFFSGVRCRIASQRCPSGSYSWIGRFLDRISGTIGIYTHNVAVSFSVANSFGNYPKAYTQRMSVIYNGVNTINFNLVDDSINERYKIPKEVPFILAVGRLTKQKRHDVLIEAISRLDGVHLGIAGHGELLEELTSLSHRLKVTDRVHFFGHVPKHDLIQLRRISIIHVHSSLYEGMSNSILEALALGQPILASDIPAIREILTLPDNSLTGLLIDNYDPEIWAIYIHELIHDTNFRNELSYKSRIHSLKFSENVTADKFLYLIYGIK